jgi:hypothetical protein
MRQGWHDSSGLQKTQKRGYTGQDGEFGEKPPVGYQLFAGLFRYSPSGGLFWAITGTGLLGNDNFPLG